MRFALAALLLCACAAPSKSAPRRTAIDTSVTKTGRALIDTSKTGGDGPYTVDTEPYLSVCDHIIGTAERSSWAFAMMLECSKRRATIVLARVAPTEPVPARILCGGTIAPRDVEIARAQKRLCRGRSGWVTPESD